MADDTQLIEEIEAPESVVAEFRHGLQAQLTMAALAQAKLNRLAAQEPSRMIDGVGQLVARVDADVYFAMRHRFGPDCWRDPAFRKACERNELLRPVKSVSGKTTVVVNQPIGKPKQRRIEIVSKP
jgi:hypothetical protein